MGFPYFLGVQWKARVSVTCTYIGTFLVFWYIHSSFLVPVSNLSGAEHTAGANNSHYNGHVYICVGGLHSLKPASTASRNCLSSFCCGSHRRLRWAASTTNRCTSLLPPWCHGDGQVTWSSPKRVGGGNLWLSVTEMGERRRSEGRQTDKVRRLLSPREMRHRCRLADAPRWEALTRRSRTTLEVGPPAWEKLAVNFTWR